MTTKPNEKKTADMKKYMSSYMKKKYYDNHSKTRNYKNSINIRKRYVIDEETWNKYKENLHAVITLKEIIDELPEEVFKEFMEEYQSLHFEKKKTDNSDNDTQEMDV